MKESVANVLKKARDEMSLGRKLSKQASYARRAPEKECLPHYAKAKQLLEGVLQRDRKNREALLMMSEISEAALDYESAIKYIGLAFEAGEPKTKKTVKRLALLRESANSWRELVLDPESLRALGDFLEAVGVGPDHSTMDVTREWLSAKSDFDPDEVISALERRGAFSDFQVLANVVYG